MRVVRRSRCLLAAWAGVVILGGAACNGPPPARGFHSRQLLTTRDPTVEFNGYGPGIVYYTTSDGVQKGPLTFWSIDTTTGHVENLGMQFATAPPPDPGSSRRLDCQFFGASGGPVTIVVTDSATGIATTIGPLRAYSSCPTINDPFIAVVQDDDMGKGRLWLGPYDQLQPAPLALVIDEVAAFDFAYLDPTHRIVTVLAAPDDAPDSRAILDIDLATFGITPVVPAVLTGGAWAPGATSEGALQSDGLSAAPVSVTWTVALQPMRYFSYRRRMNDGSDVLFVGPFPPGSTGELALFPVSGALVPVYVLEQTSRFSEMMAWQRQSAADASASDIVLWDDRAGRLVTCAAPPNPLSFAGLLSLDAKHVAFTNYAAFANNYGSDGSGPLLLVSSGEADPCQLLASGGVSNLAFSNDALLWLEEHGPGDATLWTAAPDGTAVRAIGTGNVSKPHFVNTDAVELRLGTDLVWVDLRDDPPSLHYIAEKTFGDIRDGDPWVTTGYDLGVQDETGTLGVINRDTREKRRISPAVSRFMFLPGTPPAIEVAYLVRGRNPSSQDGIWAATITAADLQ
jgi:hypothetical protein